MSVLVDADDGALRAMDGAAGDEREVWGRWYARAREAARPHAVALVATATALPLDEVRGALARDSAETRALIARAASCVAPSLARGLCLALEVDEHPLADLERAIDLAAVAPELPWLVLAHPPLERVRWALVAVERCPALPIALLVRADEVAYLARALSTALRDRFLAGIIRAGLASAGVASAAATSAGVASAGVTGSTRAADADADARFARAAGWARDALVSVQEVWQEAARAADEAPPDRARSLAERLLFEALDALPETRGLFMLNHVLVGARFGPRDAELDLAAPVLRIAIEVDGPFHFIEADDYRRDRRKDALLQRHGYLVSRALATDVVDRLGETLEAIVENVRFARARQGVSG